MSGKQLAPVNFLLQALLILTVAAAEAARLSDQVLAARSVRLFKGGGA